LPHSAMVASAVSIIAAARSGHADGVRKRSQLLS
jgi:hypothetical protein